MSFSWLSFLGFHTDSNTVADWSSPWPTDAVWLCPCSFSQSARWHIELEPWASDSHSLEEEAQRFLSYITTPQVGHTQSMPVSQMAPYSLYSSLPWTGALVKRTTLYREWGTIWDSHNVITCHICTIFRFTQIHAVYMLT